jgi:hypothetical protein
MVARTMVEFEYRGVGHRAPGIGRARRHNNRSMVCRRADPFDAAEGAVRTVVLISWWRSVTCNPTSVRLSK